MKKYILYILLLSFIAFPVVAQVVPSYHQGFVTGNLSKRPNLWKNLKGLWKPSLGVTGLGTDAIKDISPYKNHGTTNGSMTMEDWVISGNPKMPGYALNFNGSNGYIQSTVPNLPLGNSPLSISAWVFCDVPGASDPFVSYGISGNAKTITFTCETVSGLHIVFRHGGGNIRYPGIIIDTWFHVVIVVPVGAATTDDVLVYINSINSPGIRNAGSDRILDINNSDFFIGKHAFQANYFNGLVDDVHIWSRALLPTEILDIYQHPNAMLERRDVILVKPPAGAPAETTQVIIISQLFKQHFKGFEFLYN